MLSLSLFLPLPLSLSPFFSLSMNTSCGVVINSHLANGLLHCSRVDIFSFATVKYLIVYKQIEKKSERKKSIHLCTLATNRTTFCIRFLLELGFFFQLRQIEKQRNFRLCTFSGVFGKFAKMHNIFLLVMHKTMRYLLVEATGNKVKKKTSHIAL